MHLLAEYYCSFLNLSDKLNMQHHHYVFFRQKGCLKTQQAYFIHQLR